LLKDSLHFVHGRIRCALPKDWYSPGGDAGPTSALSMSEESVPRTESRNEQKKYEVLSEMADLLVQHGTLPELIHHTAHRLEQVAAFQFLNLCLYDPAKNTLRLHLWEGEGLPPVPIEAPIEGSPCGWVWQMQEPLLIRDLAEEERFSKVRDGLRDRGYRSYALVPLTSVQKQIGVLGIASRTRDAYTQSDLRLLQRVGELVATAVEGVQTREALEAEKEAHRTMVEMNRSLVSSMDVRHLFPAALSSISTLVPHEFAGLCVYDPEQKGMRNVALGSPEHARLMVAGSVIRMQDSPAARAYLEGETKQFRRAEMNAIGSDLTRRMIDQGIQSILCVPLKNAREVIGVLNVGTIRSDAFNKTEQSLLNEIATQIGISLENARAYREIAQLRDRLEEEKQYLRGEIQTELNFEEIIGESPLLKRVLSQARTVAPSGATVLILGETGTGKELIARAIHRMSGRKDKNFIKLNCAAIPTGLLESELFGHEKGAFTGAISQKVGRLELADKGTLFLDEVGDIPLELQPKLLRVLQDQEFERLGSNRTIRVDVRMLAATNRDLTKSVAEGRFRSDLFYRLNVFPIRLPALRERIGDVPLLIRYFVQKLSRRMDKNIETIPNATMAALSRWKWPGNVRELENFLERSVILTEGSVLRMPLGELEPELNPALTGDDSLETAEREHILRVLRECGGVLAGPRGAALKLGLKRTTLQSKMRRLHIEREDFAGGESKRAGDDSVPK
jgi:formate hydrogenlyase transcriptional activator